ncbi:MAG: NUDIX hydrolase [Firmicutes bacterium]|nr:NUDIX hydrolase [Bacillota bacterium]
MRELRKWTLVAFRVLPVWISKWAVFWLKRKFVVGVVAVLPDAQGRFLFLHHTYRKKRPWRLPGGLKERHEDIFTTVVRELKEEANLTVRAIQVVAVQPSEITLDVAVLCELLEDAPFIPNEEIDDFVWVDPEQANFVIPEEQLGFIAAARIVMAGRKPS